MPNAFAFSPDCWLIASPSAFQAMETYWREQAGRGSLLDWRLANGLIQYVAEPDLATRMEAMTPLNPSCVSLLFDHVDPDRVACWDALANAQAAQPHWRLVDWRDSPVRAAVGMNSPDRVLLDRLRHGGSDAEPAESLDRASIPAWDQYEAALSKWERDARARYPDQFAQAYPAYAGSHIVWYDLIEPADAIPQGQAVRARAPANDDAIEYRISLLAAGTADDAGAAVRIAGPEDDPCRWTLTWAPIVGDRGGYLIFQSQEAPLSSLIGSSVQVSSATSTYDLGQVQGDGVAELRIDAPIDLRNLKVRIAPAADGRSAG